MRKFAIMLPVLAAGAAVAPSSAAAQSFKPAVVSTDLAPLETVWHFRAALNVAALGCRDADEATTVAAYNHLLHREDAVLGQANDAITRRYQAQYGAHWEDAREHEMTQLYNFFAQPAAQAEFCATAKQVLARAEDVAPADLPAFARASLAQLEAPFWSTPADQVAAHIPGDPVLAAAAATPVVPSVQH